MSTIFYYVWNVLSLGMLCAFKVAVRKAVSEANALAMQDLKPIELRSSITEKATTSS